MTKPPKKRRRTLTSWLGKVAVAVLILSPLLVYWPVLGHGFLDWDDVSHILSNPHILNLPYIWSHTLSGMYMPVTFTVWSLLLRCFGDNPLPFHLVNLLFHIGNTLLIYYVLRRLLEHSSKISAPIEQFDWHIVLASAAGALFFSLHPMQVEAVSWITSLKDLLCAFFSLIAIYQYTIHVRSPGRFKKTKYGIAVIAFVLAMLCKSTAVFVVLTLVILNLYFWKRIRLRHWLGLVPFCLAAALILRANYDVQSGLLIHFYTPLWARPLIALDSLGFYLGKVLWPLQVLPAYGRSPRWLIESGIIYWSWIPATFLLVAAFLMRRRLPAVWSGLLFFIAGIILTLGLVNFSAQDNSTVYDKYVYLAMLGPAYVLAAIFVRPLRSGWLIALAVCLAILGMKSAFQTRIWRNDRSVWTYVLSKRPDSPLALVNLGYIENREGNSELAFEYYSRAVEAKPYDPEARNNFGAALAQAGQIPEAGEQFLEAVRLNPTDITSLENLSRYYFETGDMEKAERITRVVVRRAPHRREPVMRLGEIYLRQGHLDLCVQHMENAFVRADALRRDAEALTLLGVALARQGNTTRAIEIFREALLLDPEFANAKQNLDRAQSELGRK